MTTDLRIVSLSSSSYLPIIIPPPGVVSTQRVPELVDGDPRTTPGGILFYKGVTEGSRDIGGARQCDVTTVNVSDVDRGSQSTN